MAYEDLISFLHQVGKDPSRLIFEDELTSINNRRFLFNYFEHRVRWDALDEHPLSLLLMDVDDFKRINDRFGHQIGDQVLMSMADRLKAAAGPQGLAIRYAGDEFVLLLPRVRKSEALQVGESLLQRVREDPLPLGEDRSAVPVTLSIGVATAPDDARDGRSLLQKADTALYSVKKSGRDGLADAAGVDPEKVFAKAALHQLEGTRIAGRGAQLFQVAEAFNQFSRGRSQFVVVQGAAGMGKSTFLETIHRSLAKRQSCLVKASGIQQEQFRPYYVATQILLALLEQKPDHCARVFGSLSREETGSLAKILPQLGPAEAIPLEEEESAQRESLFNSLLHLILKILETQPLILLIDDLPFADEATLLLLRTLVRLQHLPVFVCGTAADLTPSPGRAPATPFERLYSAYQETLGMRVVTLTPLTAADIAAHIRGIFPQVNVPDNVARELAGVSQGNPLFLGELLRKLVLDQKVSLVGQQWTIEPFEEGYLPRSLAELVRQKIAALDEDSRHLLAQASMFGEVVSLSFLSGSSKKLEAGVLDCVDRAAEQGLLRSNFQQNDEVVQFPGKSLQQITYDDVPEDLRQELHEVVGDYEEALYQKGLFPSASTLAYHYTRSGDQEKADKYARIEAAYQQDVFNAQEADVYSGEKPGPAPAPDVPLDPGSLGRMPAVLRLLLTAVRSIKLYPAESKAVVTARQQLLGAVGDILTANDRLNLVHAQGTLFINGQKLETADFKPVAESMLDALKGLELEGLAVSKGFTEPELRSALEALARVSRKDIARGFWQRFCREQGLSRITFKQVRYVERVDPGARLAQLSSGEEKLDREDVPLVHEIIRCLLSAAKNIKLYPVKSRTVTNAVGQLAEAVQAGVARRAVLTLSRVGTSLLVNGERIDVSEFRALAESFLQWLQSLGLNSLTFLEQVSGQELQKLVEALAQVPGEKVTGEYWKRVAREQGLSGILFDRRLYEVRATPVGKGARKGRSVEEPADEVEFSEQGRPSMQGRTGLVTGRASSAASPQSVEAGPKAPSRPGAKESFESLLKAIPERVHDLLMKGNEPQCRLLLVGLFQGFRGRDPAARRNVIERCAGTLQGLPLGAQGQFIKLAMDPLLLAVSEERDPVCLKELVALLRAMAANLIPFADYLPASRIFMKLHDRQRQLQEVRDIGAQVLAEILAKGLEPATLQLLAEGLKSGDPAQQRGVAQLLRSLDRTAMPLLVNVIKQAEEYRVRQIAAGLLGELGPEAAPLLKRELMVEAGAKERTRILDVIDTVTKDLRAEFAQVLSDESAPVRDAAFRLAERLNDKQIGDLLLTCALNPDTELAAAAIRCLGKLRLAGSAGVLISLLHSTSETDRIVACCRALAQIADPASIEPLARLLTPRGLLFFRKPWSGRVRANAAFALGQIPHPDAARALAPFVDDGDPRVREIARTRVRV